MHFCVEPADTAEVCEVMTMLPARPQWMIGWQWFWFRGVDSRPGYMAFLEGANRADESTSQPLETLIK